MKLKSLILTLCLSLFALSGLLAQEKYEYATLMMTLDLKHLIFNTADTKELIPTNAKDVQTDILKKINELSDKGWEVYSIADGSSKGYYLRKKKNQ